MQMTSAELPAAHQLEENSLSVSSEPEFHVVVKNTFIDIVETSPRSIHRSRSEPPRFVSRDVEKRSRCQTAVEDVAVSFAEQHVPEAAFAPAMETVEPSEIPHSSQECSVRESSTLRLALVEVPQPWHVSQEDSLEDRTNPTTVVKTSRGEETSAFSSIAFPAFEVRNTFIEVCEDSPKVEALRPVRSAQDLLAWEW
jgi:hypothetical protein